jgi:hypothetical protein
MPDADAPEQIILPENRAPVSGGSSGRPWGDLNGEEENHARGRNELVLTRLIDAPREKLFRCWTEPALLKRWFARGGGKPGTLTCVVCAGAGSVAALCGSTQRCAAA